MKIVFFGTSAFSALVLKNLIEKSYDVAAVVTRPDRPQGRSLQICPPPVKKIMLEEKVPIKIYQPEKASTDEFAATLSEYKPDLFLVVAYGEILKEKILNIPSKGCINIHASLLPKYRGAAPIQRCIMNGESETGITIIEMVVKMDAGDILAQEKVPIDISDTALDVEGKLISLSNKLVTKVIDEFDLFYQKKISQDESLVTFAAKILPDDLKIDWNRDASAIHNQIRALSPEPCANCTIWIEGQARRLKVRKSQICERSDLNIGEFSLEEGKILVGCGRCSLYLLDVQLEGKKFMSSRDFAAGFGRQIKNIIQFSSP